MRTNEQTVAAILEIIDNDAGFCAYSAADLLLVYGNLSAEDQQFLNDLPTGDLENVVCGESKLDAENRPTWLVSGAWVNLPASVEAFLEGIYEGEV
jgi:hypothetical protein